MTYREMMLRFAKILGLKRWIFDVPVLTPRLSAYWVNIMTPVPAGIAFPLIEGLKSEMVCEDDRIRTLIPIEPLGFVEAVNLALDRVRRNDVLTALDEFQRTETGNQTRVCPERLSDPRRAARAPRSARSGRVRPDPTDWR